MTSNQNYSLFACTLRRMLDQSNSFTREDWASLLGVSQPALSNWLTDKNLPRPELLRMILDKLRGSDELPDGFLESFWQVASLPAAQVTPHARRVGSSIAAYMVKPVLQGFLRNLHLLPPKDQERRLLCFSAICRSVRDNSAVHADDMKLIREFIEEISLGGNSSQTPNQRAFEVRLPSGLSLDAPNPIVRRLSKLMLKIANDAGCHASRQLHELLGAVAERFGASTAAIFCLQPDGELVATIRHNVQKPCVSAHIDEAHGIVAWVARHRSGYCTSNVDADPLYREDTPGSQSEIAVPIIDPTATDPKKSLLGVINLECRKSQQFTAADTSELEIAAQEFVAPMLVLAALSQPDEGWIPWHPDVHGWDMSTVMQQICHAFTDAIDRDSSMVSLWYADRPKKRLFVYATSGYDYEYKSSRYLPWEKSCIGRYVDESPGRVYEVDPSQEFMRNDKAEMMGLKQALLCPVRTPKTSGGVSVLNAYFTRAGLDTPVVREALVILANAIGCIVSAFDLQRQRIAESQLRFQLDSLPRLSGADFEVIRDFFSKVFAAPGVTVFSREARESELQCMSTTGLAFGNPAKFDTESGDVLARDVRLDVDKEVGYTTTLAKYPGKVLRVNNVLDRKEPGLPDVMPENGPQLKFSENFAPRQHDNRRLLAVGIGARKRDPKSADGADSLTEPCDTLGVIRVVRPSNTKPFTICDERLVKRLSIVCRKAFIDWRRMSGKKHAERSDPGFSKDAAIKRLTQPLAAMRSPERLTAGLLKDLFLCYRGSNVSDTALYIRHSQDTSSRYRLHARCTGEGLQFPEYRDSIEQSVMDQLRSWLSYRATNRERAVPTATALSFDTDSNDQMGVCIPLSYWHDDTFIDALVKIGVPAAALATLELQPLLLATSRLSSVWGAFSRSWTQPVSSVRCLHPEVPRWSPGQSLKLIQQYAQQRFEVKASLQWSNRLAEDEWCPYPDDPAANKYGVLGFGPDLERFAIPLHFGPLAVANLIIEQKQNIEPSKVRAIIAEAINVWSQLSLWRSLDFWNAKFKFSKSEHRTWSCAFSWIRNDSDPGRTEVLGPLFAEI